AAAYCLVDAQAEELACYDTQADAQDAKDGIELEVRERTWGVIPSQPEPTPTPTPTPSGTASATPTGTPTPTTSPSPSGVELFSELDRSGAEPLPSGLGSEEDAQAALDAIAVQDVSVRYCVVSSADEDLGCYLTQSAAEEQRRATGQQRLLNVIGTTARLEERPTIQIVAPGDPNYDGLPLTCGTEEEQASDACKPAQLDTQQVVYLEPSSGSKVLLGPVVITGANIDRASAQLVGGTQQQPVVEWVVTFELDGEGADAFAAATTTAVSAPPPQNQIAIVVDRQIVSNPVVQSPITNGVGQISGSFTEETAKDLATVLNAGALPVELTRQSVRTVSPTLGEESLHQGIVAGIVGLILLFLYLLVYYRLLGVVAWFGMTIWAILALALVSIAGQQFGYALTLAGVAGLVISLGITADSYIVFFERLKDEMRGGKSARTVVQPAFSRSFRTVVAADVVTGIAAAVLYLTAVSSVRGFALTLGVATMLDLFVVWFFKRPTVILLARNTRMVNLRGFGLRSATAADHEAIDSAAEVQT
ncbi:MAG TPA: protein translocase subunit SecD, partial [Actinomycetota bacterium]